MTDTPQVLAYRGKFITDMTREELIEALNEAARTIKAQTAHIQALQARMLK